MKKLSDVLNFLNQIPNINRGGCGYAALAVHDWLIENKKTRSDVKIVHLDYYELPENPSACSHVAVKIGNKYVDSKGVLNVRNYKIRKVVSKEFHIESLKHGNWNNQFKKHGNLTKIEKTLNVKIKQNGK